MKYQIGQWRFDTETRILASKAESNTLPKLLGQLLLEFIQNPNKVLNRDELIEKLWKNKYVNENALSRTVAELRKELNDSANKPQFIKTIPKKGYQFVHPVIDVQESNKNKRKNIALIGVASLVIFSVSFLLYNLLNKDSLSAQLSSALSKAQRITAKQGMERQPSLSPDGKKLAYTKIVEGKSEIIIYDLTDQKEALIIKNTELSFASPVFSNSNKELIAIAKSTDSCHLFWKNLITLKERIFASCTIKSESVVLDWSNDDSYVIFSDIEEKYGTAALWKINLNDDTKQQLTFPESAEVFDVSPKISPNNKYLSFSRGNHSVRNIYIQEFNSTIGPTVLTDTPHYTVSHDWIDNQHIILDSDKTGERLLWLVDVTNKKFNMLGARGAQYPSIDTHTNTLSFQVAQFEANIWMIDLNTNKKTLLVNSTKYDNNPAFHPKNNSHFAYTSNRLSHGTIWTYDYETKKDTKIFEIPKMKLTRPFWSNDGSKLLVSANGKPGLWSYEFVIKTGEYRKIPFKFENYAAVYIDDDIYAMSKPINGESTLLKLNTKGEMSKLDIKGISRFMPLSNNQLAISKANINGLYIIDLDGSNERTLIENFQSNSFNHWTASGSNIYYRNDNSEIGVWKINSETLKKEKVTGYYPYSVGPSMSVHPNQSKILMTQTNRAESDIFITHLNLDRD